MRKFSKILIAVDFSDSSVNAFQLALSMARQYSAQLIVLHVINEPVDLRGFYVPHISFDKLEEEIEQGARKMMDQFERKFLKDFSNFTSIVSPGIPYDEIIKR